MNNTYEDYLNEILLHGTDKSDRTGTGTRSLFGCRMAFDLSQGFPLITTKKVSFKMIALELQWFLKGMTNVRWLQERGVSIWDEWADENGDLGPVYGSQWRSWPTFKMFPAGEVYQMGGIDQIANAIHTIKTNPDSRRIIVSAWNPAEINQMKLPPCHALFQFYVAEGKLSCQLYQRSADSFLGVPYNIASYALLTHLMAHSCGLEVGEFIWVGGDCHIYSNHFDQVRELLSREPRPFPKLLIHAGKQNELGDYSWGRDFEIVGYDPHPAISAPVAV